MLPAGFVVNREKKAEDSDSDDDRTLEDKIEEERAALPVDNLTPVTKETFRLWKEKRARLKQEELEAKIKAE